MAWQRQRTSGFEIAFWNCGGAVFYQLSSFFFTLGELWTRQTMVTEASVIELQFVQAKKNKRMTNENEACPSGHYMKVISHPE